MSMKCLTFNITDSGWEPLTLNIDNAKYHPMYDRLISNLLINVNGTRFYGGNDKYNFFCFIRWIAMASVGGGWMSDYDTLPLYSKPTMTLPNNGSLSIFTNWVPNLVSGSAAEWNRMTEVMFNNYKEHSKNGKERWSDMFEMFYLIEKSSQIEDKPLGLLKTIEINEFFGILDEEDKETKEEITNPYDLSDKCDTLIHFRAIHFSHHSCYLVKFCHGYSRRHVAERKWYQSWLEQCK